MKKYLLIIFIVNLLIGCQFTSESKDYHIDTELIKQIHDLNAIIIDGIFNNEPNMIASVSNDKLQPELQHFFDNLDQVIKYIERDSLKTINEFYKSTSLVGSIITMSSGGGNHDYSVGFKAFSKKNYIYVGYFDTPNNQMMLFLIYGKYGNKWLLNTMQISPYKVNNKDAYDWYIQAKNSYDKGYLINAANAISISQRVLKPGKSFWKYVKEDEIITFASNVFSEINKKYIYPMPVDFVDTNPKILGISMTEKKGYYYPVITYQTSIDLREIDALKTENSLMHKNIEHYFKGVKKENKRIFYRVVMDLQGRNSQIFVKDNSE